MFRLLVLSQGQVYHADCCVIHIDYMSWFLEIDSKHLYHKNQYQSSIYVSPAINYSSLKSAQHSKLETIQTHPLLITLTTQGACWNLFFQLPLLGISIVLLKSRLSLASRLNTCLGCFEYLNLHFPH